MITKEMRHTICEQIGRGNILCISGGRVLSIKNGVELPVSNGYCVRVEYDEGWDHYTVTRVFKRAGREWIKGQVDHVYCDQVGRMAYRAGMFLSWDEVEWVAG